MGRLIPLVLRPSSDIITSMTSLPSPTTVTVSPPIPEKSPRRNRLIAITELTILPYTKEEWMKVMEEVKYLFLRRQYKQCSARCVQILGGLKDPYRVLPLYSIYLSFYAASSLEQTARSLHQNSSNKLPLLQESLNYYKKAESFMEYAAFSADSTIVEATRRSNHRSTTSDTSSIRSSVDSVFSQASSATSASSSAMPSPTTSFCSTKSSDADAPSHKCIPSSSPGIREPLTPAPLRVKKKVSFSLQLPTLVSEGDISSIGGIDDSKLIESFPFPPALPDSPTLPPTEPCSISSYLLIRSLNRYRTQLNSLHNQIHYHINSVNSQITHVVDMRKARRSNLPNIFTDFGSGMNGVDKEEMKKVEMTARLQRLKENGWRRDRFDGEKYHKLCEKVLEELETSKRP